MIHKQRNGALPPPTGWTVGFGFNAPRDAPSVMQAVLNIQCVSSRIFRFEAQDNFIDCYDVETSLTYYIYILQIGGFIEMKSVFIYQTSESKKVGETDLTSKM